MPSGSLCTLLECWSSHLKPDLWTLSVRNVLYLLGHCIINRFLSSFPHCLLELFSCMVPLVLSPALCFLQGLKAKLGFACWCIRQKLQVMGSEGCQRLCNRILWLNKLLLHWGIFRWQSSFDFTSFSFLDVRQGLIGVGLINVEDRSGILTLDKGTWVFNASVQCPWEHLMSW